MNTQNHTLLSDLGDFPTKGVRQHHNSQYDTYENYDDTHARYRSNKGQEFITPQYTQQTISCREIVNHVDDCPICKKFYDSDNNMYIIIIIILLFINIYLLRKLK